MSLIYKTYKDLNIEVHPFITECLKDKRHFLVGGCVRDALRGEQYFSDIDIVVMNKFSTSVIESQTLLYEHFIKQSKNTDEKITVHNVLNQLGKPIIICHIDGVSYDITVSDSYYFLDDMLNRDFTMNSIYYDYINKEIYSIYSYIEDVEKGLIRFTDAHIAIKKDPVRMIRGLRFKNSLNMEYLFKPEYTSEYNHLLKNCAMERVRTELLKILDHGNFYQFILDMKEYGYIKELIPELDEFDAKNDDGSDKYPQPAKYHSEGNPWNHTMLALKYAQEHLMCPTYLTLLAVLFHDIGKPTCFEMRERGGVVKPTFYEHDRIGGKMVQNIMKRLKFSNFEIDYVSYLVKNHMNMFDFFKMRESGRIILASHHLFNELLMVHKCDIHGSIREDREQDLAVVQYDKILEWYEDKKEYLGNLPERLINGNDLLELGAVGPAIGKILDCVWKLQLEGKIKDKDSALKHAKGMITI